MCLNIIEFCLVFILRVQNGPELNYKLSFHCFKCPLAAYGLCMSCMAIRELAIQFSLKMASFSLHYAMRIMFDIFSFAFWVIITKKCEVDLLSSLQLACTDARPISKMWHIIIM